MQANKKILSQKSNKQLESYLQDDSRFTVEAIRYAYEILKEREHPFAGEEEMRIQKLIDSRLKQEVRTVPENFKKSAEYLYFSVAFGAIYLFVYTIENPSTKLAGPIFNLILHALLAYLISIGKEWMKYVTVVFFALNTPFIFLVVYFLIQQNLFLVGLYLIIVALQVYSTILLFLPQKPKIYTEEDFQ